MKIMIAITPLGTFETVAKKWTSEEEETIKEIIRSAFRNKLDFFEIETANGPIFFGSDTMKNTVFRIETL